MPIFPGRYTARTDEPFVVFLIGMRINRFFQFRKWMQVAKAMRPMIAELKRHPEMGLLHVETVFYRRGIATVQYWRSFEHLHSYAKMKEGLHLPAWAAFNRAIGNNRAVGIWHETFMVQPGNHEAIYVNMPRFGLGAGVSHEPISGRLDSAYGRMRSSEPVNPNLVEK
jgi:hypothetical protein